MNDTIGFSLERNNLKDFTLIQNQALEFEISDAAFRLYCVIVAMAYGKKATCWPSQSTLAVKMRKSIRQVQRLIAELEASGIIKKVSQGYKKNHLYIIVDLSAQPLNAPEPSKESPLKIGDIFVAPPISQSLTSSEKTETTKMSDKNVVSDTSEMSYKEYKVEEWTGLDRNAHEGFLEVLSENEIEHQSPVGKRLIANCIEDGGTPDHLRRAFSRMDEVRLAGEKITSALGLLRSLVRDYVAEENAFHARPNLFKPRASKASGQKNRTSYRATKTHEELAAKEKLRQKYQRLYL